MKKLIILCTLFFVATVSFAQTEMENEKRSAFHFSFLPPLSTHGKFAADYTNSSSFSLLAGLSKNEEYFALAGLANIVRNDANGFLLSGLFNYAGNEGKGFLLSGLANIVSNDYTGFQLSGLVNKTNHVNGFQFGGLGNIAADVKGIQFGGLGNIAADVKGVQFGGLGNIAADVKGFQFGGLFNVAGKVSGVQFAGLVNIAESSDWPIALLNIIKNGEYGVAVTYNEAGSTMVTFRSGGRVTYGILGAGYNHKTKDKGYATEGGFGAHIPVTDWFRINNEIKGGSIGNFSDNGTLYANYALLPAFRIAPHFELFGGPSINYMQTDNVENRDMFPGNSLWKRYTESKLQQLYIGWQAGIQFVF